MFFSEHSVKRALHKSHVNGAKKLKLNSYIGIGKYFGACPNFSARGRPGVHNPPNVNLGPPIFLETIIKLKTPY